MAIASPLTPAAVNRMLQQFARSRERLTLYLPDAAIEEPVLVAEATDGTATLTLLPVLRQGPVLGELQTGDAIVLHGRLAGAPFELPTTARAVERDDSGGHLVCDLPQSGSLHERRELPRFPLPSDSERAVAVVHLPGEILLSHPVDISRAGVRLRLDTPEVDLGELQVLYCELRRGKHLLQSKLELRWQAFIDSHLHFGGRFLARDTTFSNALDRLVAEAERHWLAERRG